MNKQKRVLAILMAIALFVGALAVSNASAAWMSEATIVWVHSSSTGDYTVRAKVDTWYKTFTIQTANANAQALLAIALTAASTTDTVTVDYTGANINNLYLNKE